MFDEVEFYSTKSVGFLLFIIFSIFQNIKVLKFIQKVIFENYLICVYFNHKLLTANILMNFSSSWNGNSIQQKFCE